MVKPGPSKDTSSSYFSFSFASLKQSLSSFMSFLTLATSASNANANGSSSEPKVRRPSQFILTRRSQHKPKGTEATTLPSKVENERPEGNQLSKYSDFKTIFKDYQTQLSDVEPTLNDLLLSIDLNVNCVCSSVVFDVTVLECGHLFCRNCIRTWTTSHKKRCPYCRVMTNADFSSDQIERLMAELDLIQIRHVRFSRKIEYEDVKHATFQENLMAESPNTFTFKCCHVKNYFGLAKYLLSEDQSGRNGETLYVKHFPDLLYSRRTEQLKRNRRKEFCWPWVNEAFRRDMILTFGLYLLTYVQMCTFSATHARMSDWTWAEFIAAGVLYVWSSMCLTYSIMLLR